MPIKFGKIDREVRDKSVSMFDDHVELGGLIKRGSSRKNCPVNTFEDYSHIVAVQPSEVSRHQVRLHNAMQTYKGFNLSARKLMACATYKPSLFRVKAILAQYPKITDQQFVEMLDAQAPAYQTNIVRFPRAQYVELVKAAAKAKLHVSEYIWSLHSAAQASAPPSSRKRAAKRPPKKGPGKRGKK